MAKKPALDGDAAKIRDEALKRALSMPHKPHAVKTKPKPKRKEKGKPAK